VAGPSRVAQLLKRKTMKTQYLSLVTGVFLLSLLISEKDAGCGHSGIRGHVYLVQGNQMPSPDIPPTFPKGIRIKLYIYELTNISQVSREGVSAFYKNISTSLVKEVESGEDGSYSARLKPGRYSLFVKKGDLFYSSMFDDKNNIHPVEVKKGEMTEDDFRVNYDAAY
jgi:hypothetical protein